MGTRPFVDPDTDAPAEDAPGFDIRRDGFDGAGWFFAALFVALVYGLGISSISDGSRVTGAGEGSAPTTVPARVAFVIGDGS